MTTKITASTARILRRSPPRLTRLALGLGVVLALGGCASIYPLNSVAKRTADPRSLQNDVTIDSTSREILNVRNMAWVAFSVTFECQKNCPYSVEERNTLAREIAETSFAAFDRELRRATSTLSGDRKVSDLSSVVASPAFGGEVRTSSFRSTVSRWLARLGLTRSPETVATARGLKAINPEELGWSGGESLTRLGKNLGVDGVLVGHIRVTTSENSDEPRKLVIKGPRIWLFSALTANAVAVAGLRPTWSVDALVAPAETTQTDAEPTLAEEMPVVKTVAIAGGIGPAGPVPSPILKAAAREAVTPAPLSASRELHAQRLDWSGLDAVATNFSDRVAKALANQ